MLAVTFGILLILPDTSGNYIGRIGLWCGLVSQLLLAVVVSIIVQKYNKMCIFIL